MFILLKKSARLLAGLSLSIDDSADNLQQYSAVRLTLYQQNQHVIQYKSNEFFL